MSTEVCLDTEGILDPIEACESIKLAPQTNISVLQCTIPNVSLKTKVLSMTVRLINSVLCTKVSILGKLQGQKSSVNSAMDWFELPGAPGYFP